MHSLIKYLSLANNFWSYHSFLVLRYARTRPLNGKGLITRILRKTFPILVLKSKKFYGLKLVINPSNFSHVRITDEFFFENVYDLERLPFRPNCIVDCGAHIGMFTLLSKGKYLDVPIYIFEPNAENILYIKKQITQNNLSLATIEEAAVSNYSGTALFEASELSFGGYLSNDVNSHTKTEVKVIDLTEYLEKINVQKLLIKIDIEGEEENIIPSIINSLPQQTAVYFEYHYGLEKFKKIKSIFEENGFVVKINRVVDNRYIDALSIRN
jgi:FkbM family methyltransferase